MAFSPGNSGGGPMAEINVTPLVDVMLVLLIIFMITAPLMSHKIRIDLPQANPNVQEQNPPEPITWRSSRPASCSGTTSRSPRRCCRHSSVSPRRRIRSRSCRFAPTRTRDYQLIATVMANAKNAGMVKIGFITTSTGGAGQ